MAQNPLGGLMSISVVRQTGTPSGREPPPNQRSARHGRLRQPRSWCESRPRSDTGQGPAAPGGQAPGGQARGLRSHHSPENAARERSRVRNLRQAFHSLQAALPSVPRDTKLSKLDVLLLATNYITQLTETLEHGPSPTPEHSLSSRTGGYLHPVKKWPMRSLLYCGNVGELLSANQTTAKIQEVTRPVTPVSPVFDGDHD